MYTDNRFSDKEKKLLKQMKFSPSLNTQVDMSKIKIEVIKPWIQDKLTDILNMDDDVVVNFVYNQLEVKYPDPKKMQINLTGFLQGKYAMEFMADLWDLLISAQDSPNGIPESLMDLKREELAKKKEEARQGLSNEDSGLKGTIKNEGLDESTSSSSMSASRNTYVSTDVKMDEVKNKEKLEQIFEQDVKEDELETIGKHITNKLRNLARDQRIYAEKIIMDALFEAQLGSLNRNSKLQLE